MFFSTLKPPVKIAAPANFFLLVLRDEMGELGGDCNTSLFSEFCRCLCIDAYV